MKILNYKKAKKMSHKKGYSLLEIVISLGIIGIILTLFFNILVSVIDVSLKSVARSVIREELATTTNLIGRDIRNADEVLLCGGDNAPKSCEMNTRGENIRWQLCLDADGGPTQICRYVLDAAGDTLDYVISESVKVEDISFESGFVESADGSKQNIIFTIQASHVNERMEVNNVLRQVSTSTRNYTLE